MIQLLFLGLIDQIVETLWVPCYSDAYGISVGREVEREEGITLIKSIEGRKDLPLLLKNGLGSAFFRFRFKECFPGVLTYCSTGKHSPCHGAKLGFSNAESGLNKVEPSDIQAHEIGNQVITEDQRILVFRQNRPSKGKRPLFNLETAVGRKTNV